MAAHSNSTNRLHVDWARIIPTAAPFAAYLFIMAIVALCAEG